MIDTIVLMLNQGMFAILDHDRFSPSTKGLYDSDGCYRLGGRANITCKQNPTRNELKAGIYKPRLTVTKRMNRHRNFEITLKIEFSIPKLIFGNNFDELDDTHFSQVISKLKTILKEMGIGIFEHNLIKALVSSVHYSKNIVLTDYTTAYTYLNQLSKININKQLDTNRTDFRNEGHSFKYRANTFEVVFYDKIRDLKQAKISDKRAEEQDNAIQLNLFDTLKKTKPFEVLRMEIRLNRRQKIRQILRKIEVEKEPTFQNLFRQDISQKVLLYFLSEVEEGYLPLLTYQHNNPKDFFTSFIVQNPKLRLSTALKMTGLKVLLDEVGTRGFRELAKSFGNSAWYSINREMGKLNTPTKNYDTFTTIHNALTAFEPLRLVDFIDN